ncbi:hypothetical protein NP233_g5215 [Leucocoprinus birnbaumii]|uniref:DNA-directed RNA polymerase RBP11-like dimerisation domain-containing protein n=1 Tax=Leucocoprinus birnbaumii TaxID=56174 RepID=A0AAD5VUP2_9AGAR|nr:hypothetical protein NP233_g5215 [Leucocoprinus birnbaumii]
MTNSKCRRVFPGIEVLSTLASSPLASLRFVHHDTMTEAIPKIKILQGATADLSAATYQIHDESHTIGNALRWMLMKNPKVEFCGYSVPHPSENVINVRIQMYDNLSSLDALINALGNLDNLSEAIEEAYVEDLRKETHETWTEEF